MHYRTLGKTGYHSSALGFGCMRLPTKEGHNLYVQKPKEQQAQNCAGCRECETKCPQHIPISEWMPKVHDRVLFLVATGRPIDPDPDSDPDTDPDADTQRKN